MVTYKMTVDLNVSAAFLDDIIMINLNYTLVTTSGNGSKKKKNLQNGWARNFCNEESLTHLINTSYFGSH